MDIHSFIFGLLSSSLMGGILTVLILLLRRISSGVLGASWRYLLWFFLIARLLIPSVPESSWSVYNFIHLNSIEKDLSQKLSVDDSAFMNKKHLTSGDETAAPDLYLPAYRNFFSEYLLTGVWLAGGFILAFHTVHLNRKKKKLIRCGTEITDERMLTLLNICKEQLKIKRPVSLIRVAGLSVPMVTGIRNPKIILPENVIHQLSEKNLQYILLHELSHLRRGDLWINWLLVLLQIAHWFNPVLWYAFHQMRRDRELACDADVLSRLPSKEYKKYGEAIIAFLAMKVKPVNYNMAAHFTNDTAHLRQRMKQIAWYEKFTWKKNMVIALFFMLIACFVLTNATNAFRTESAKLTLSPGQTVVHEDLSPYFSGYNGAFVLYDIKNAQYRIYNEPKSLKRVSPNSTYKIVSALIGLETGAIADERTLFSFQGNPFPIAEWNQSQTLSSALRYSVNWYFQTVDAHVGESKIHDYLNRMNYGNCELSGNVTDFWLENSLKISPLEQVELLTKLYLNELPISPQNTETVRKNIPVEKHNRVLLSGKTGTGSVNGKNINGWFVGYAEAEGNTYVFAVNIEGNDGADGAQARNIALSILKNWSII